MGVKSESPVEQVPVLVVGGGVVGLSAALFLLHQGARSGELFRQVGLFDEIRDAGAALQPPVGIYAGETLAQVVEPMPRRAPGARCPRCPTSGWVWAAPGAR